MLWITLLLGSSAQAVAKKKETFASHRQAYQSWHMWPGHLFALVQASLLESCLFSCGFFKRLSRLIQGVFIGDDALVEDAQASITRNSCTGCPCELHRDGRLGKSIHKGHSAPLRNWRWCLGWGCQEQDLRTTWSRRGLVSSMAFAGGSIPNRSVTSAVWSPSVVEAAVEVAGAGALAILWRFEGTFLSIAMASLHDGILTNQTKLPKLLSKSAHAVKPACQEDGTAASVRVSSPASGARYKPR